MKVIDPSDQVEVPDFTTVSIPGAAKSADAPDATVHSPYYTVDSGDPFALDGGAAAPIHLTDKHRAANHQWSTPLPPVVSPAPPVQRRKRLKIMGACVIIVVGMGILVTTVFASPTTSPPSRHHPVLATQQPATLSPIPTPSQPTGDWVPAHLPAGWEAAGLNEGDELFAWRTAMTFTDREMSIDFRNVGTAANHGGTLTAAKFILTPAAQQRFLINDVRETAAFFAKVTNTHLIQVVVNVQPQNIRFQQTPGGQRFAVVDVAFQLWQSTSVNGQTHQGKDLDPATGQPRTHHMVVLLLRFPPGSQGNNPPMGGTGWEVSNYALDSGQPTIVQPA